MPLDKIDLDTELTYLSILDAEGNLDAELEPDIPDEDLRELYKTMALSRAFDHRREQLQRQGRIGTFAPSVGQEAAQLGSVYAIRSSDWFVPSFRETAATIWRGMPLADDLVYTAGYEEGIQFAEDSTDLPITIPVGSQIPHAVGIAWGIRLAGKEDVVLCYLGDGATSEGDFHEGLNFAAVMNAPVVFLCQNNQWAISVPLAKQTRSRTLAQKGFAYGIPSRQVDGNDLLAVYRATREAVDRARAGDGPSFIEAVTYRLKFHTTADDPTKYRDEAEVERWRARDPLPRFRSYLREKGVVDDEFVAAWDEEVESRLDEAVKAMEARLDGDPLDLFDYAYDENPPYLERQREELARFRDAGLLPGGE